jgi:hypothetical protein
VDAEWKIKQLEEEARHEHAMRLLHGQRLDTHDEGFGHIQRTLDAVAGRLQEITQIQQQFAIDQAKTELMLRELIQAITREHSNGKGK